MSDTPERNPHHADDTGGQDVILVAFTAEMVPHDSPEFRERARRPRPDRTPAPQPPNGPSPDRVPPPAE